MKAAWQGGLLILHVNTARLLNEADLAAHKNQWVEPFTGAFKGVTYPPKIRP